MKKLSSKTRNFGTSNTTEKCRYFTGRKTKKEVLMLMETMVLVMRKVTMTSILDLIWMAKIVMMTKAMKSQPKRRLKNLQATNRRNKLHAFICDKNTTSTGSD